MSQTFCTVGQELVLQIRIVVILLERVYGVVSECSGMPILQLEGKLVTFMFP